MIEIIEHKDYNRPTDNDTIVETSGLHKKKKKLFKVLEGIWLDPEALELNGEGDTKYDIMDAYNENYCQTVKQKSKYLEQMTILFKRINSTPLGQGLLNELYKGSPINFHGSPKTWDADNMITSRVINDAVNRKLRATVIINPLSGYIDIVTYTRLAQIDYIGSSKTHMWFNPDATFSLKEGLDLTFIDPAIVLFHELTHVLHNTYGTILFKEFEEFITFGYKDAQKIALSSKFYSYAQNLLSNNLKLLQLKIDHNIPDKQDKEYYKEKYGFKENQDINTKFLNDYIDKYLFTYTEYKFTKELGLVSSNRASYKDKLFVNFKHDISDPKIYTVEGGFVKPTVNIEELKSSPTHVLANIRNMKDRYDLNSCFNGESSRHKRGVTFEIIPLEPLGEDIDSGIEGAEKYKNEIVNNKEGKDRGKREAGRCQEQLGEILEYLDTVYEQSKQIPRKFLGKHAKTTIDNVPKDIDFNVPPEDTETVETVEPIKELETFKVGELVGFDRITPKDVLNAHRINHNLLEGENPIHFMSEDIGASLEGGNITYTHNKEVSKRMQLMHTGKAVLKGGNTVVNIAQFGMWVDELIEDFKGETGKDNLHIANDVLSIVPYLGQAVNIGVDIKDGNYLAAVETLGILVLLEVFPELMLPLFLIGLIVNAIQKNQQQKEMVSKAVWNILMEREQLLDSQLETEAQNLAHICIERIQKIADHVERQLTFNAQSIRNNIKYYGKIIAKDNVDHNRELERILSTSSVKLYNKVQEKRKEVVKTLFSALKKTIVTDFKEKAKGEINQFNEQTKNIIKDMLKQHSNDISSSALDEGLNIVETYMKTHDIGKEIKKELDKLCSMLEQGINILIHQTGVPLVYSHVGLNKNNKAVDKLTNKELENQNVSYAWGRNGNSLKFESGNSLKLQDYSFRMLTLAHNFTIEFWIKVPLTKNYDQETFKNIPIIKNGFHKRNGWAFVLNGRYLNFTIHTKIGVTFAVGYNMITKNKWTKITVVHYSQQKKLSWFINGKGVISSSILWVAQSRIVKELNNHITISVPEKTKNLTFSIDDFKVYTSALTPKQVRASYKNDTKTEILYDYFGNCLRENREYVLAVYNSSLKMYHPINQHNNKGYWIYNFDREPVTLFNYDLTLRISKKLSSFFRAIDV